MNPQDAIHDVETMRARCDKLDQLASAGSSDAAHVLQPLLRERLEAEGRLMLLGIHLNPDGVVCYIDDAA